MVSYRKKYLYRVGISLCAPFLQALETLPNEIKQEIFSYLSFADLAAVAAVAQGLGGQAQYALNKKNGLEYNIYTRMSPKEFKDLTRFTERPAVAPMNLNRSNQLTAQTVVDSQKKEAWYKKIFSKKARAQQEVSMSLVSANEPDQVAHETVREYAARKAAHNARVRAFVEDAPYFPHIDLKKLWDAIDENYVEARKPHKAGSIIYFEKAGSHGISAYQLSILGKKLYALPPAVFKNVEPLSKALSLAKLLLYNANLKYIPENWFDIQDKNSGDQNFEQPRFCEIVFSWLPNLEEIPASLEFLPHLKHIFVKNCPGVKEIQLLKPEILNKMAQLEYIEVDPQLATFFEDHTVKKLFKRNERQSLWMRRYHRIIH